MKGRKFDVGMCQKLDHPYAHDHQSKVYTVDGVKAKTIHLIRGHTYMFNIKLNSQGYENNQSYEFYFTRSPVGGERRETIKGCKSVRDGPLLLEVTNDLPEYFYYQDKHHKYMGGLIQIHSPEKYKSFQSERNRYRRKKN